MSDYRGPTKEDLTDGGVKRFVDDLGPGTEEIAELEATIAKKDAEIAELRKDAERYRWMRQMRQRAEAPHLLTEEQVDAEIDDAIALGEKPNE
jgi:hypothetical protein